MRFPRGLSLAEVLLALALMGLVAGFSVLQIRPSRAAIRGAAEVVAEEFRYARSRAVAKGTPVAAVLPGGSPVTQSLYCLEGWELPRVVRARRLAGDFGQAYLFSGYWPVVSGSPTAGGGALVNRGGFSQDRWGVPPGERAFVFLPSGAVVSDQPSYEGAFHVVVCDGLTTSPGSLEGRPFYRLDAVSNVLTVRVTLTGDVTVAPGVPGANGVASLTPGTPPPRPAQPPAAAGPNRDPVILGVANYPVPNPATLPPGVSATVKQEGYLTLAVEASDPDGDPLALEWRTTSGEAGNYSAAGRTEMHWDSATSRWRGEWEWRPPPGAAPGTRYLLTATVSDGRGGTDSDEIGATGTIEVLSPGRIAFVSDRAWPGLADAYTINPDGTDVTRVTTGIALRGNIAWSPDGARLCFDQAGDLFVAERDGSGLNRVTDGAAWGLLCDVPCFAGDGTMVAFLGSQGGSYDVYLINLDGSDPRDRSVRRPWRLTNVAWPGFSSFRGLAAHADGERLVVDGALGGPGAFMMNYRGVPLQDDGSGKVWPDGPTPAGVYEVLYGGVPSPVLTDLSGTTGTDGARVALSFDGSRLGRDVRLSGATGSEWWSYATSPGVPGSLGPGARVADGPGPPAEHRQFSPDENQVTYLRWVSPANCEIYSADPSGANERNLSNHAAVDFGPVWSPR
ncbi:MAG: hypothetical protein AB1758_00270 [Candidatus Eremiobacterota bacterium]